MQMYLPIIKVEDPKTGNSGNYFLFQDVYAAITHMSSSENIRDKEL